MSSNFYFGIKDPEYNLSFMETEWLTPHQVVNKLNIKNMNCTFSLTHRHQIGQLLYPNELILNDSQASIVDLILLAKHTDQHGNSKLKSVFLSQLVASVYSPSHQLTLPIIEKLFVLSLSKDSYYWSSVRNAHVLPRYALRVGFDNIAKNLTYIGRMKINSLVQYTSANANSRLNSKITNLFGALINVYEHIPAIVLQLHEVSDVDEKHVDPQATADQVWPQHNLRLCIKNTDFNLVSANYEVLCLKKQPATLKQSCIITLVKMEEKSQRFSNSLKSLPNSIRNLLWPACLLPGQSMAKMGKMRSINGIYEVSITEHGLFKITKVFEIVHNDYSLYYDDDLQFVRRSAIFEKNIESLICSTSGIYLVYDNNQATRRPILLYKSSAIVTESSMLSDLSENWRPSDKTILSHQASFVLELTNDGLLRVVIANRNSKIPRVKNLINLNDFFKNSPVMPIQTSPTKFDIEKMNTKTAITMTTNTFFLSLKINCIQIPLRIIDIVATVIRTFVRYLLIRVPPIAQLN